MPLAARTYGSNAYPVFFAMVVIVSMLWFLWEITPGRPLPSVASTLLVFAYVGGRVEDDRAVVDAAPGERGEPDVVRGVRDPVSKLRLQAGPDGGRVRRHGRVARLLGSGC